MTETNIIGYLVTAVGGLLAILVSIVIHELRLMRKELNECVTDKQCHMLMNQLDKRITKLEDD